MASKHKNWRVPVSIRLNAKVAKVAAVDAENAGVSRSGYLSHLIEAAVKSAHPNDVKWTN